MVEKSLLRSEKIVEIVIQIKKDKYYHGMQAMP